MEIQVFPEKSCYGVQLREHPLAFWQSPVNKNPIKLINKQGGRACGAPRALGSLLNEQRSNGSVRVLGPGRSLAPNAARAPGQLGYYAGLLPEARGPEAFLSAPPGVRRCTGQWSATLLARAGLAAAFGSWGRRFKNRGKSWVFGPLGRSRARATRLLCRTAP